MKYVLILLLAFHLGACSPRILVYNGTSQNQIDEFNQAVFKREGIVLLMDSSTHRALNIAIRDTMLCWTEKGTDTCEPLKKVRSIVFRKKNGLVGVIPGFILGLIAGPLAGWILQIDPDDLRESDVFAFIALSGIAGSVALSQISRDYLIYDLQGEKGDKPLAAIAKADLKVPSLTQTTGINTDSMRALHKKEASDKNVFNYKTFDYSDQSERSIKAFNELSSNNLGSLLLIDSTMYFRSQFRISNAHLYWVESATMDTMFVPMTSVQKVEIIKRPGSVESGSKSGIGLGGALIGGLIGALISAAIPTEKVDSQGETLEGLATIGEEIFFIPLGVIVGGIVGANAGSASADRNTKITVVFHEPVGPRSKLRQDPERFKVRALKGIDKKTE